MDDLTPPTPAQPQRQHRARRVAAVALLTLSASLGGLWGWTHTEGSLATALRMLAWALPAAQTLQFERVQGSLQQGGYIGHLRWHRQGLDVQVRGSALTLDWSRLREGHWPLTQLQLKTLTIEDQSPASTAPPPSQLRFPLRVDLPWQIEQVQWASSHPVTLHGVRGHYRFDGQTHALTLHQLELAQGRYQGQATLGAAAPMPLALQLQGDITAAAPGSTQALPLQAHAQLQGHLAGASAQLQLQARIQPTRTSAQTMQLQLEATLQPWQTAMLSSASAQATRLDLASLWPGAPHTQLQGQLQAHPEAAASGERWLVQGTLSNALPGPWDKQRLPLQKLDIDLSQENQQWQVSTLKLAWPGGGAQAQGQWQPDGWQGQATIEHLRLDQLHTALTGPALSGTLQATQTDKKAVTFDALLQAASESATVKTHGQWTPDLWKFEQLELRLTQALLQGQGQWQPSRASLQGAWRWAWPGLQGQLEGQLSPEGGQGRIQIDVQDAQRSLQWLQRWPSVAPAWQAQGQLQARAQWQGGWQQPTTQLQAQLDVPQLQLGHADSGLWQWRASRLQLEGTLQQLQAQAQGQLQNQQGQARFDTRWQMGHTANASPRHWEGLWQQAQLQWTSGSDSISVQLQNPMAWQWDASSGAAQWAASSWRLQGPSPGQALLQIERGDWTPRAIGLPLVHLRAELSDLPLQWAHMLGAPETQGDLLLKGALTLSLEEQLNLQARLQRSRGRLLVAAEGGSAPPLDASIQTALAELRVQGQDAQLQLQWDTEQAGQLQARLQSQLNLSEPAKLWPAQAPLSGQVTARLPRIGTWSWLAPPGWRVQGSLDAAVDISGTRTAPLWSGRLQAQNLAARSAVEGIEFSQGQLQARLQAQSLVLEQFSIRGAGAQGGDISAHGQIAWPSARGEAATLDDVQMRLQLNARGLRVSNRADRRLTVSGQVEGRMDKGRMQLSGQLTADQAQFTLPDDTTPTLGEDVVVKKTVTTPSPPKASGRTLMGTPEVRVLLDLGPDFRVQGHGLSTRLAGQVTLSSSSATQNLPRLSGQVRTEGGRFKAYGQQLDIDQGLLRFNGPYDNPQLDIVALRPNLSQRVGVTVTGTALAPRVRLYAAPDMPDADKLAWLVLGRSPAGGGAESAVLQQAAMALLGGNGQRLGGDLANALGLDEISVASGSRSTTTTSSTSATGTAITLGKRLSKDFYLVYESSLSGAFGSLYVFYDLSRRLTLRAQAGDINALDLVYTVRRD